MQIILKKLNNNNCLLKYNVNTTIYRSTIKIHHSLKIGGYKWFYKFLEVDNVSSKLNVIRKVVP